MSVSKVKASQINEIISFLTEHKNDVEYRLYRNEVCELMMEHPDVQDYLSKKDIDNWKGWKKIAKVVSDSAVNPEYYRNRDKELAPLYQELYNEYSEKKYKEFFKDLGFDIEHDTHFNTGELKSYY